MKKRTFLKKVTGGAIASTPTFQVLEKWIATFKYQSPEELAKNEKFWLGIRSGYRVKPDYINLESGYYCLIPEETLEKYIQHIRQVNYQGSWYMRTVQWDNKRNMANKLAQLINAEEGEVCITRNTTESLDTIIGGFPWQVGDEAVMADQDYGAMLQMFKQVARRFEVVNKRISVPNHPKSDSEIVELYATAITDKTKLMMVCHMINITGQILPIRKICDMAHSKGVEVLVDGAHCTGHIQVDVKALDCDYYGASLHKWLSVPLGSGLLYVKKDKIAQIWPRFGDGHSADDIRRLNHTGTHPVATDLAVGNALEYLERLGLDNKTARLRYLQQYWTSQVRGLRNINVNTPKEEQRACGIANVGIEGMKPHDMAKTLLDQYRIWTVAIDGAGVHGCRICPNIFTTIKELDIFVAALKDMSV